MPSSLVQFLAVFFGVALAFGLTFWYDRHKRREEQVGIKKRTLLAIRPELDFNLRLINDAAQGATLTTLFSTVALDSAVSSGHFSLLDEQLQLALGSVHHQLRLAEMWSGKSLQC